MAALCALVGCGSDDAGIGAASRVVAARQQAAPTASPTALVGAGLRVVLRNDAAGDLEATISGTRLSGPDDARAVSYGPIAQTVDGRSASTVEVAGLAPGVWLHRIAVPETGQQQFRQSLVVDDPSASAMLAWTLFATVLRVNSAEDRGNGRCDASCTLRDAVTNANTAKGPALIVFDHAALGRPARVRSDNRRVLLNAPGLTIDGTDEQGNPSPLEDFRERLYPVRITLRGTRKAPPPPSPPPTGRPNGRDCPCTQNYGGTLFASARGVRFVGLRVDREYPDLTRLCCGNQTLIHMGPGSLETRVDTCLLDGGGRSLPTAVTPKGMTGRATSKDCVKPENAGSSAAHPMVVANSEISFCLDRGVKVKEDFLELTDNWIHNNLRAAVFAIVPSGKVHAVGNLIEENAMNCPSGAPPHCDGQQVTRPDGPQVSTQGNGTAMTLDRNVIRRGPYSGVYWQVGSTGRLSDSFVCGLQLSGVLSQRTGGKATTAAIRGSASVLNGRAGAEVRATVGIDLGTAGDPGRNAFAGNPHGGQVVNSLVGDAAVSARGNQWGSCYPASHGEADRCDADAIEADVTNNTDASLVGVDVGDPEPQLSNAAVTLDDARPSAFVEGALVALRGSGFDAVSGVVGLTGDECAALATTNTCAPLRGTCVEFLVDDAWVPAADVLGVTPTTVMVRAPFTCSAPTVARVRRAVLGGGEVTSNELAICRN